MKALDPKFTWYWRVIGYRANGSVVQSVICETQDKLDELHDAMHELPEVRDAYTAGPFPRARVTAP